MIPEEINPLLTRVDDKYWWSTEDIPAYEYLKNSHKNEMDIISKFLKNRKTVVQAGAHCGFVIKELEDLKFETIYTFEPDPAMFLALCMNVSNPNVFKIQGCVGNEHKLVNLVEFNGLSGARYVQGEGKIPMFKIDDLNLNSCDLIMLDTEGYEHMALVGGVETIKKFKPVLCLERCWGPRTTGIPEQELDQFLASHGYKLVARAGESDHIYAVN